MNSPTVRPGFAAAIRKALAERNESAVQLAAALAVSSSTLRTWLNRRRFPKDQAVAIAAYFGWNLTAHEIEARYDIGAWAQPTRQQGDETKSLYEFFQQEEKAALRLSQLHTDAQPNLLAMLLAMQKGDAYFHVASAYQPHETLPDCNDVRNAIARGVLRGAFFVYICPSDQLHRHWLDEFSVRTGSNGSAMDAYIQILRGEVRSLLINDGQSEEKASSIVERQIITLQADSFPWFSVGLSYTLIATLNPVAKEPLFLVLLSLPGDHGVRFVLPQVSMFAMRISTAALRLSIGRMSGIQMGDISVFAYLMEHPDLF